MSHFEKHVFFCLNQRDNNQACCADYPVEQLQNYCKQKVKSLGLAGAGKIRINKAGCLDRCEHGPVMVVYPEAVWYTFVDEADIDEIVEQHLQQGNIVNRLNIDAKS